MNKSSEKILIYIFVIQIIISLGWIAVYPFGGYISLILIVLSFFLINANRVKHLIYFSATIPVIFYYFLPREYGPPNTNWILIFLIFFQFFYLKKDLVLKIFDSSVNFVLFLCICSLSVTFLVDLGLPYPSSGLEIGNQIFEIYRPFYIDRINISKDFYNSLIFSFRFHGPFFLNLVLLGFFRNFVVF